MNYSIKIILQHPAEGEETKPPILNETSCLITQRIPLPQGEAR